MTIEIRGIPTDAALRARAIKRLGAALAKLPVEPTLAQITFFDENGPKGGRAMRCALTVRVPYRPHLRVEEVAETPRLAFDGSFEKLERELERYRERDREGKRHPKKYFTAKRLVEGLGPPTGESTEAPTRRAAPGRGAGRGKR